MKRTQKIAFGMTLFAFSHIGYAESLENVTILDESLLEEYTINETELGEDLAAQANEPETTGKIVQPNKNIRYVPMPTPEKPQQVVLSVEGREGLQKSLRGIASKMKEFVERMSRGKVKMTTKTGLEQKRGQPGKNNVRLVFRPGAHSHVPIIGNSITAKHELFHQFGLGHANIRFWGSQQKVKQSRSSHDPFDPMTVTPGVNSLNAAHIDHLGWFNPTEEAYADVGGEYILRLINDGNRDFNSLKSLYYEVPGTSRKFWFSYVRLNSNHKNGWKAPNGMPDTAIVMHSASGASTFLEGLIGPKTELLIRNGLILEVSEPTLTTVKVKVTQDPNWILEDQ